MTNPITTKRNLIFFLCCILSSTCAQAQEAPILTLDPGGHMAPINDLAFTPDGRYLLSAGDDKVLRVWDTESGHTVRTLRGEIGAGQVGQIYAMALSPGADLVAIAGWMAPYPEGGTVEDVGAVRLYDLASGALVGRLRGHTNIVVALAFSPDGSRLVSGSLDKAAIVWDVAARERLRTLAGHKDAVYAVAFTTDGERLVTGSDDKDLRLWRLADGALVARLAGHGARIEAVALSPDGKLIASGSADRTIRLWDAKSGRFLRTLAKQKTQPGSLSFSPDGALLLSGISGGADTLCRVYRVADGKELLRYAGHDNAVLATAVSPDGKLAATGGGSRQEIHLWSLADGKRVRTLGGAGGSVWAVGFSEDSRWLAWGKTQQGAPLEYQLRLPGGGDLLGAPQALNKSMGFVRAQTSQGDWHLRLGKTKDLLELRKKKTLVAQIRRGPDDGIRHRSFTFTPDGATVIGGGANGILGAYSLRGDKLGDFVGHGSDIWDLAVSPDGRLLASASADQTVRVWDVATRALLVSLFHAKEGGPGDEAAGATVGDWILWTPQGYYSTSARGDSYIGWHQNRGLDQAADYYPAERFAARRYRPEIVSDAIELGSEAAALARAQEIPRQGDLPSVETLIAQVPKAPRPIQVPSATVTAPEQELVIGVGRQERLLVSVNGRPIERRGLVRIDRSEVGPDSASGTADGAPADPTGGTYAPSDQEAPEGIADASAKTSADTSGKVSEQTSAEPGPDAHVEQTADEIRVATRIGLEPGENRIDLLARNAFGDSPLVTLRIDYRPAPVEPPDAPTGEAAAAAPEWARPSLYLLAIGVSEYADDALDLQWAASDATALAERFRREAEAAPGLYREVHTRVLLDAEADRAGVLGAVDFLFDMTQNDLAILFVAGHGMLDPRGDFYFLPHDIDSENLRATGVRWDEFRSALSSLPGKVILLADTCHSGTIYGTRGRRAALDMTQLAREFAGAGSGVVVFASSQGKEYSLEDAAWGHGAFTKSLLDGLNGAADYEKDQVIHLAELELYVQRGVVKLTEGQQHPVTIRPDGISDFPLSLVTGP